VLHLVLELAEKLALLAGHSARGQELRPPQPCSSQ
jgi:hypothetical protein